MGWRARTTSKPPSGLGFELAPMMWHGWSGPHVSCIVPSGPFVTGRSTSRRPEASVRWPKLSSPRLHDAAGSIVTSCAAHCARLTVASGGYPASVTCTVWPSASPSLGSTVTDVPGVSNASVAVVVGSAVVDVVDGSSSPAVSPPSSFTASSVVEGAALSSPSSPPHAAPVNRAMSTSTWRTGCRRLISFFLLWLVGLDTLRHHTRGRRLIGQPAGGVARPSSTMRPRMRAMKEPI